MKCIDNEHLGSNYSYNAISLLPISETKSAIRIPVTIVISKQTATIAFILLFFLNEFSPTNTFEVAHKNYYEKEVGI